MLSGSSRLNDTTLCCYFELCACLGLYKASDLYFFSGKSWSPKLTFCFIGENFIDFFGVASLVPIVHPFPSYKFLYYMAKDSNAVFEMLSSWQDVFLANIWGCLHIYIVPAWKKKQNASIARSSFPLEKLQKNFCFISGPL